MWAGSGTNSIGTAIATVVVDAVREVKPPFSPEGVVADFAALLRSYRVREVWVIAAGEFPRELFRRHGIAYTLAQIALPCRQG
jgi:hypothetical protein